MIGFGTALALPFGVLSFFPNVLSKLPKSGGWLQQVKVSLGFVELALALKFFIQCRYGTRLGYFTTRTLYRYMDANLVVVGCLFVWGALVLCIPSLKKIM
jgi:thiol:disulfide interchange protein